MAAECPDNPVLREKLRLESGVAEWALLREHIERDAAIIVTTDLDMIEAAYQIARDNTAQVRQWLNDGQLIKPAPEQIIAWQSSEPSFSSVVVAPFVLIQEIRH